MNTIKILTLLGQENTIKSMGFIVGLTYTIFNDSNMCVKMNYDHTTTQQNGKKNTTYAIDTSQLSILENPLSTLFVGSFNGVIYGLCASFVGGCLPNNFRPLVPIVLGFSMINSVHKYLKN